MALLIDNQNVNFSGTRNFGPVAISDAFSRIKLVLGRRTNGTQNNWNDPATHVEAQIFISINGGPFTLLVGFGAEGGTDLRPDGTESPASTVEINLPPGVNRQARATIVVTNGPLRSVLTVEAV